jgi:hypothetical protein
MDLKLEHSLPALAAPTELEAGPVTTLERVTLLGPVQVKELTLASDVIFTDRAAAMRRQAGCVRFSYVPAGSRTPRRYRCQPDLAISAHLAQVAKQKGSALTPAEEAAIEQRVRVRVAPAFTSTRYGDPAYGQLSLSCPVEISAGAEDGAEMGAFSFLKQPQREANLRASLEEYLRFGLEAGIFYVT